MSTSLVAPVQVMHPHFLDDQDDKSPNRSESASALLVRANSTNTDSTCVSTESSQTNATSSTSASSSPDDRDCSVASFSKRSGGKLVKLVRWVSSVSDDQDPQDDPQAHDISEIILHPKPQAGPPAATFRRASIRMPRLSKPKAGGAGLSLLEALEVPPTSPTKTSIPSMPVISSARRQSTSVVPAHVIPSASSSQTTASHSQRLTARASLSVSPVCASEFGAVEVAGTSRGPTALASISRNPSLVIPFPSRQSQDDGDSVYETANDDSVGPCTESASSATGRTITAGSYYAYSMTTAMTPDETGTHPLLHVRRERRRRGISGFRVALEEGQGRESPKEKPEADGGMGLGDDATISAANASIPQLTRAITKKKAKGKMEDGFASGFSAASAMTLDDASGVEAESFVLHDPRGVNTEWIDGLDHVSESIPDLSTTLTSTPKERRSGSLSLTDIVRPSPRLYPSLVRRKSSLKRRTSGSRKSPKAKTLLDRRASTRSVVKPSVPSSPTKPSRLLGRSLTMLSMRSSPSTSTTPTWYKRTPTPVPSSSITTNVVLNLESPHSFKVDEFGGTEIEFAHEDEDERVVPSPGRRFSSRSDRGSLGLKALSHPSSSSSSTQLPPRISLGSSSTLPLPDGGKPGKKLTKKREDASEASTSFVSNLAGALAGLGGSRSLGKLSKTRHGLHPPSTWTVPSSSESSTTPSPFFTTPPSPETPLTAISSSSSGLFDRARSKSIRRVSHGFFSGALKPKASTQSLRDEEVEVDEVPPVPTVPTLLTSASEVAVSTRPASMPPAESSRRRAPFISLAYTGKQTFAMEEPSPIDVDSPPSSATHLTRPPLIHRPSSNSAKRWTIAVNNIPDDSDFLKEIENLRLSRPSNEAEVLEEEDAALCPTDDEMVWMKATRVMLCVREIMRTETSYRAHLVRIWEAEIANPSPFTPGAFRAHLPALISASATLSGRLEEDPSVYGVSVAFLSAEDELEKALVAWCGVVGPVMTELANGNNVTSMPIGARATMYYRKYSSKEDPAPKRSESAGSTGSGANVKTSSKKSKSRPNSAGGTTGVSKTLSVQDVAIMPTQRVPRYVLLFKDLLQQTPVSSPSRVLVERALEGACRIATRCDEAQQHFVMPPTST